MSRKKEDELIGQIRKKILFFAQRHLANPEAAKDLTQETLMVFLEVYRRDGVANPGNPGGLAYGIYRNKLANHFRKMKREEQAQQTLGHTAATEHPPAELFWETSRQEEVRKHLLRLSAADREILVLFFQENHTCQEVADLLGMAAHAVSVRKWRALKKMKKWLR